MIESEKPVRLSNTFSRTEKSSKQEQQNNNDNNKNLQIFCLSIYHLTRWVREPERLLHDAKPLA